MISTADSSAAGPRAAQPPCALARATSRRAGRAALVLGILAAAGSASADTMIFENGDRLEGEVVACTAGMIEFRSVRFGTLLAREAEARVERGAPTALPPPAETESAGASPPLHDAAKERAGASAPQPVREERPDPWQGRAGVTFDLRRDDGDNQSIVTDIEARRTWSTDALELNAHFNYTEDDGEKSTDVWKGAAKWRHDLSRTIFTNLRSAVEWNRGYMRDGVNDPYVLIQQDIGCGRTLVDMPQRTLRAGLAGNFLSVQGRESEPDTLETVASLFAELELDLPWQSRLTERGAVYRSIRGEGTGFENVIELNRKLTSVLSIGLRHEYREDLPEVEVEDFRRFRVQLGVEF